MLILLNLSKTMYPLLFPQTSLWNRCSAGLSSCSPSLNGILGPGLEPGLKSFPDGEIMRFGTFFGIPLKMNPFFFLFLAGAFLYGRLPEALVLFAIVLWHETSHVLMAKAYKLEVIDIELLPFGGVARLGGALLQLNPEIEWIIAIAGPASNVLLVFLGSLLFPYLPITAEWYDFFRPGQPRHGRLQSAAHAALRWGGRVLRSVLVRRRGFKQATAAIARVGGRC